MDYFCMVTGDVSADTSVSRKFLISMIWQLIKNAPTKSMRKNALNNARPEVKKLRVTAHWLARNVVIALKNVREQP